MRNKKTFVGLFVILALLCLGIGYAAISRQLSVTGKVTTGDENDLGKNFEVYFSDTSVVSQTSDIDDATIEIDATDTLSANFLISGMSQENSEVVFTLTVKNDSGDFFATSKGYEIYYHPYYTDGYKFTPSDAIPNLDGPEKKFVSVSSGASDAKTYNTGDAAMGRGNTFEITIFQTGAAYNQIAPGGSSVITIKIKMITPPTEQTNYGFKITFDYDADAHAYTS